MLVNPDSKNHKRKTGRNIKPSETETQYAFSTADLCCFLTLSHLSTHFAWNSWEQGKTRRSCLASKSHMHTTQEVWSDSERTASQLKWYAGSCWMSLLLRPFCFASPRVSASDSKAWGRRWRREQTKRRCSKHDKHII